MDKPCVVNLIFDPAHQILIVEEAKHGRFESDLPASGDLPFSVQVEGKLLGRFAMSHSSGVPLTVLVADTVIEIHAGAAKARLARLEGTGAGAIRKPMPIDRRHKGKVEPTFDGRRLTPKGDTWLFSAQVPFHKDTHEPDDR
jgi:hypothetical protein